MRYKNSDYVQVSDFIKMSAIGAIGVIACFFFFPWARIGRFAFKISDYLFDNTVFMNGIQWYSGWGTPQEAVITTAYMALVAVLPLVLILLGISIYLMNKKNEKAALFAYIALGVATVAPFSFIVLNMIINISVETTSLTLFPWLAMSLALVLFIIKTVYFFHPESRFVRRFNKEKTLWMISGIALAWLAVFAYVPMVGIVTAFFNYRPGMAFTDMEFVGLRWFRDFFMLPDFLKILRNTLVISGLNLTIGFVSPIIFALLLNELLSTKFKRTVQTISYLPYFVSWVVVASIMNTLLTSDGVLNEVLLNMGIIEKPISFMQNTELFWWVQIAATVWKGIGWSSIIYLAAISGVDQELYQAGAVDGLGRFGRMWHITLPGIRVTVVLLFILGIGGLLNTGFEYQLLIGTPLTREVHEVVDTYVFRYGVQMGRYSFATAVGLMKSVIGFTLVIVANWIAKKVSDISIL